MATERELYSKGRNLMQKMAVTLRIAEDMGTVDDGHKEEFYDGLAKIYLYMGELKDAGVLDLDRFESAIASWDDNIDAWQCLVKETGLKIDNKAFEEA